MAHNDKIVRLTRGDGLADPDRARLEAHWRDIGGATDIPFRDAVDPGAIASSLDRVLLLERIAPRRARVRLTGHRITARLGFDLRDMPLCSALVPPSRDWLGDALEALFDTPARVELGLAGPRQTLRPRARAALLLLPLRDRSGAVSRALGFLTLPPGVSNAPVRFEIAGESRRSLQVAGTELPAPAPDLFGSADHAREVIRRRAQFHVVQD